ncbi:MAG: hypothetical protein J1F38_05205 [Muribaculaceae bacterium]|nr:hypothetical protein [Muribaculaceae bacterium]
MERMREISKKICFIIGALCYLFLSCSQNNSKYNDSEIAIEEKSGLLNTENLLQCDTFLLDSGVSEFRVRLYNFFPEKYLNDTAVRIVEKTWEQDSITNKTVWYKLEKGELQPVDSLIWSKESEF